MFDIQARYEIVHLPNFGKANISRGLRKAITDRIPVKTDPIYLWHRNRSPVSWFPPGQRAKSSRDPDCSEVFPVTAVVFSPQFSS